MVSPLRAYLSAAQAPRPNPAPPPVDLRADAGRGARFLLGLLEQGAVPLEDDRLEPVLRGVVRWSEGGAPGRKVRLFLDAPVRSRPGPATLLRACQELHDTTFTDDMDSYAWRAVHLAQAEYTTLHLLRELGEEPRAAAFRAALTYAPPGLCEGCGTLRCKATTKHHGAHVEVGTRVAAGQVPCSSQLFAAARRAGSPLVHLHPGGRTGPREEPVASYFEDYRGAERAIYALSTGPARALGLALLHAAEATREGAPWPLAWRRHAPRHPYRMPSAFDVPYGTPRDRP